ncbi:hypothetical protein ID0604_14780 [Helicobacter pylori]
MLGCNGGGGIPENQNPEPVTALAYPLSHNHYQLWRAATPSGTDSTTVLHTLTEPDHTVFTGSDNQFHQRKPTTHLSVMIPTLI